MENSIKYYRDFENQKRFEVVNKNILEKKTDCIVNAANGMLAHGGGVAAAIAKAAGELLVNEGNQIIQTRGRIPVGECVITTAGNLPFKGVIHAVGPRQGEGNELEKLISALRSAFEKAHQKNWLSLSFPAVSSGIFAVPYKVCAKGYLNAIEGFFSSHLNPRLKLIRLCLFEGQLMDDILQYFHQNWY